MKPRDTRPGAVALDAASRKVTTPGVVPRPPPVDDAARVPRRTLEVPASRGAATEPMAEPPSGGRALRDTNPATPVTLPEPPRARLADTSPDTPRRPPSASDLLASTAVTPPAPPNVDAMVDMARLAKATPVIPERADSDGAKNARFATEGVPARAAKVTMPTGEVILEPGDRVAARPEEAPEATAGPRRRRAALPTAPSGRVLELEDAREFRREGARGVVAGVSIALALLAALLVGTLVFAASRKPTGTVAPPAPSTAVPVVATAPPVATLAPTATLPSQPAILAAPPEVPPTPTSPRGGVKAPAHSTAAAQPVASVQPTATPPPTAPPSVARPVPTDITHDMN